MKRYLILTICLFISVSSFAKGRRFATYEAYVHQYSDLAVVHMKKYKIPASITLAQGLLESGAGKGRLAREGNNHFGIKCHEWTDAKIYQKDDGPNDCFRVYKRVDDSYDDHSKFLAERQRYAMLFSLNPRDYQAWAKGLKQCGYATDPNYANKLIKLIEDYELYRFDEKNARRTSPNIQYEKHIRQPYKDHDLIYVVALEDDSFDKIARDLGFKVKDLVKWNEVPKADFPLFKGDIVYLEKKKKKAEKPFLEHRVQAGESMHKISQMYGIQVKRLYKLNHKDGDYVPEEDEVLRLR
ncbi:N-acetylmuramoyl-L-alanine amidase [Bacteroidia bacterium]|nr:N-acetylmuramoyl-L-alanine amidase [Bacteroidia bacterium]